jgi:hypothetical protein
LRNATTAPDFVFIGSAVGNGVYHEAMKIAQAMLVTDGVVLLCYGALSLLFVPGSVHEPYLSSGRVLYGVLPAALGVGSLVCAIWLGFARSNSGLRSFK